MAKAANTKKKTANNRKEVDKGIKKVVGNMETPANTVIETPIDETTLQTPVEDTPTVANIAVETSIEETALQTPVEDKPTNEIAPEVVETAPEKTVEDVQTDEKKRFQITVSFDDDEAEHLKPIIAAFIEVNLCDNKSDFGKLCIDFCINFNAAIKNIKGSSSLQFPFPEELTPKLLRKSLFADKINIPTV